jgi:hypothetical protein
MSFGKVSACDNRTPMDWHDQSLSVAPISQFNCFPSDDDKEGLLHRASVAYGANLVVYSAWDKRGLRVEVVGNFLWGPGFCGNWLVWA